MARGQAGMRRNVPASHDGRSVYEPWPGSGNEKRRTHVAPPARGWRAGGPRCASKRNGYAGKVEEHVGTTFSVRARPVEENDLVLRNQRAEKNNLVELAAPFPFGFVSRGPGPSANRDACGPARAAHAMAFGYAAFHAPRTDDGTDWGNEHLNGAERVDGAAQGPARSDTGEWTEEATATQPDDGHGGSPSPPRKNPERLNSDPQPVCRVVQHQRGGDRPPPSFRNHTGGPVPSEAEHEGTACARCTTGPRTIP